MRISMKSAPALLLCLVLPTQSSPLDKRAILEDCLAAAGVSTDAPGSTDWAQDVAPYNERLQFKPVSIVVATTTKQIQDSVACAVQAGVKANAKCGGHSYASFGLGGENGHLVIELDRMDKVVLNTSTGIAEIGGGSRLGHVAAELYAQGQRGFSHGTCPGYVHFSIKDVSIVEADLRDGTELGLEAIPSTVAMASAQIPKASHSTG